MLAWGAAPWNTMALGAVPSPAQVGGTGRVVQKASAERGRQPGGREMPLGLGGMQMTTVSWV